MIWGLSGVRFFNILMANESYDSADTASHFIIISVWYHFISPVRSLVGIMIIGSHLTKEIGSVLNRKNR